jgi:Ca2+-binding EF-hand superfamily protein
MVSTFFEIYDTDSDGFINANDMIRGLRCLGIQKDEAAKMMFEG